MASPLLIFVRALGIACLLTTVLSDDPAFPTINDMVVEFYTTEVQVTDMEQQETAYATEYYDQLDNKGAVKFLVAGQKFSVFYDNDTYEIYEVNETTCVVWDEDDSQYFFNAPFYGWLSHDPIIIGPSAPLWFAQTSKSKPKYEGREEARDISCDKYSLTVSSKVEDVTLYYYFAPEDWTTPYNYKQDGKSLRIPIRIQAIGNSSKDVQGNVRVPINMIYDFSYFKPTIDDLNNLLPPVGIGCPLRKASENLPDIPDAFQFSAEVVDLLSGEQHADVDINTDRIWYDSVKKIARLDSFTRKTYLSQLYDFNTGVTYNMLRDGSCDVKILKDYNFFEEYDEGFVARMKTPAEIFLFDDKFYDMGQRVIRGVKCDVYEGVKKDFYFMDQSFAKLVVTIYFTEEFINVGVDGEMESRIPVYVLVTGWNKDQKISLKMQWNIYSFNDIIWPEMYSSFQLERCYTKTGSKAYFVMVLGGKSEGLIKKMEEQNANIVQELRSLISKFGQVPDMRIPFLKIDYKPTEVLATGQIIERPPPLLQFYLMDSGPTITYDQNYKPIPSAKTKADCATACIDEGDFPCKGFYMCSNNCFLKSIDPFEQNEDAEGSDLGDCEEYIRAQRESTNIRNAYLRDALKNLQNAVLNKTLRIFFNTPDGEEIADIVDIDVGDGKYIGFPKIKDMVVEFYTTEVQVTDMEQQATAYATEYYDQLDNKGAVNILVAGQKNSIFYDNDTYEIYEVNETTCVVWDEDTSQYFFNAPFYGWLSHNPTIIGPTAPLWFVQTSQIRPLYEGQEEVRDITCDKYSLTISSKVEDVTLIYYFAPEDWTTPYNYTQDGKSLRIPIRIHAIGDTSKDVQNNVRVPINMIYDFSYFKPTIDDLNNLLPPVGIGCPLRKASENLPDIPEAFQFSAEVVDLLSGEQHADVDINTDRVWYDSVKKIARLDSFTRKSYLSQLYDFNTGVLYNMLRDGTCDVKVLKESNFEEYDEGFVARMKTPAEVFLFDDKFYDMGQREIRGVKCDAYEGVKKDTYFMDEKFAKLVVTIYFTEDFINVGVDGEMESRIPVYVLVTGWNEDQKITLKMQWNIFGFNDVIWPEMYSSFQLERCYTKPESKSYFVLILGISAKAEEVVKKIEEQDNLIVQELRSQISKYAQVPDMRIPFLKVEYKPTGVFATGLMIERPPSLLQFYLRYSGSTITYDQNYKPISSAKTKADCATACIDEGDFPCKGFYMCSNTCYLKSIDTFEQNEHAKSTELGDCLEYVRAERDSTNVRNIYLKDALKNLEDAVFNRSIPIFFQVSNGEAVVNVTDIIVGEGPYTGADAADKPYKLTVEFRKLDLNAANIAAVRGVETAADCYKKCKTSDTGCSTFSYCGRSRNEEKECLLSSDLIVKGITNDKDLIPTLDCDVYDLKFLEYFDPYPGHVVFLSGYKIIRDIDSTDKCAQLCRMDKENTCRGFEYCSSLKTCSLHSKHILDLKSGDKGTSPKKNPCVHYAAKYIADYSNLGKVLINDDSNVRYVESVEECAKVCSEELGNDGCKSFNYCPRDKGGSCSLSTKLLRDDSVTTTEEDKCMHYEKRAAVDDWSKADPKVFSAVGYTKKGFTGLVIGMLALGLVLGALGFVLYTYVRSKRYGEGMSFKFMKQETGQEMDVHRVD